jgi:hypothetical protein
MNPALSDIFNEIYRTPSQLDTSTLMQYEFGGISAHLDRSCVSKVSWSLLCLPCSHAFRFKHGEWFGDSQIDCFGLLCLAATYPARPYDIAFYPAMLSKRRIEAFTNRVHRITREIPYGRVCRPLSRFRTIIVPINVSNQHWILVAFDRPNETIYLYDSLAPSISSEQRGMVAGPRDCCASLAEHLACTYDASLTTWI